MHAKKLEPLRILGKGSFGKAYLAKDVSTGDFVVVKQTDLSKMSEKDVADARKEAWLLKKMNHPNVIKFQDLFLTKSTKLCIVMEFAEGGDLHHFIRSLRKQLPESKVLEYFSQICLALAYVHNARIIHRDLKSQNIFLAKDQRIVKLGDFGISRVLSETREYARTMVGTPYYISPEIIEQKPYGYKSDVWSLGVVLFELLMLEYPFQGNNIHALAMRIIAGNYSKVSDNYSTELRELVNDMLQTDSGARPSALEILQMPLLANFVKTLPSRFPGVFHEKDLLISTYEDYSDDYEEDESPCDVVTKTTRLREVLYEICGQEFEDLYTSLKQILANGENADVLVTSTKYSCNVKECLPMLELLLFLESL